jgi:uncharacterized protein (DUF1499 family)
MRVIAWPAGVALVGVLALAGGVSMGLFSGSRPTNLGVKNGQLAPPNPRPNNVHSQIPKSDSHFVAPIAVRGDPEKTFARAKELLRAMPRAKIIAERADYVHAEFSSPTMGFVDDTELYLDRAAKLIHVRAAARLGIRDFDVNRKRVEALRAAL